MRFRPEPIEIEFGILAAFLALGFFKMLVGAIFAIAAAL